MDKFNRFENAPERQYTDIYEVSSYKYDQIRRNDNPLWLRIVYKALIIFLILMAVYMLLHPIDKIMLKFFLFRNCTLEAVSTSWGERESREVLIDGNLIKVGSDYYEVVDDQIYTYIKTGKYTWKRVLADEEWIDDRELGETLLDKSNYKLKEGKLFVWRLKNSVAETIDELSSITLERDAGKIAIVGYRYTTRIAIRFTRFGTTKIDPPWKERGMRIEE